MSDSRPFIGIAQSGWDVAPCNRIHADLAQAVKAGIRDAGGMPIEFPFHPVHEAHRRLTAAVDRNLGYLMLADTLQGSA